MSRARLVVALLLLVVAVVWLFVNTPVEGSVLLNLGGGHGVTTADLLSVVLVLVALALLVSGRRRPRR